MFSFPFLSSLTSHLGVSPLDDSVDTLSCFISSFVYIFLAIMISAKTNVGSPIECWLPQTYSGAWEQFAENYCFLKDTYWYPTDTDMRQIGPDHKETYRLQYYQWASMFLTVGAMVFMIPKFFWKTAQKITDLPIIYFCETAEDIHTASAEDRKREVAEMALLLRGKILYKYGPFSLAKIRPIYIYSFVKFLYTMIAFFQFVALAVFLDKKHDLMWGMNLAINLYNGITWEKTGFFPRVTFCDFHVHEIAGNVREETVECVLGINEFNEKIFLFLWFWVALLFVMTIIGNVYTYFAFKPEVLVDRLLHKVNFTHDKKRMLDDFAINYLTSDGMLVLNYVKSQSSRVAEELAMELFKNFVELRENQPRPTLKSADDLEKGLLEKESIE